MSLKKVLIATLVAFSVLIITAFLVVRFAFPPQKIKALVEEKASQVIGRPLKVEGAGVRIFPKIEVYLSKISLANAQGFSADPLFEVKKISLKVDPWSLLTFSPRIEEIRIDNLGILYEVDSLGRNNLLAFMNEKDSLSKDTTPPNLDIPSDFTLERFSLKDASIRYKDAQNGTQLVLGNINQTAQLSVDAEKDSIYTEGLLQIFNISVNDAKSGLKKGSLSFSLKHQLALALARQSLEVQTLALTVQDASLSVTGKIDSLLKSQPRVALSLESNKMSLASLIKEIPASIHPQIEKVKASGFITVKGEVSGSIDSSALPKFQLKINLDNLNLNHTDVPEGVENLIAELLANPNLISLKSSLQLFGKTQSFNTEIGAWQDPVPLLQNFNLESSLDLKQLTSLTKALGIVPETYFVEGSVASSLKAAGPLDVNDAQKLSVQGSVKLEKISFKGPEFPLTLYTEGQSQFSNDKIEQNQILRLADSDVRIRSKIVNFLPLLLTSSAKKYSSHATTQIAFNIESGNLNLDTLLGFLTTPADTTQKSKPASHYPKLPPINVLGQINLARTQLMGLEITSFSQKLTLASSVLKSSLTGKIYSGTFSNTINADLTDSLSAKIDGELNLNKVEANDFIRRFNDRLPSQNLLFTALKNSDDVLFGKFSMQNNFKTFGLPSELLTNLSTRITMNIDQGRLMNTGFVGGLSKIASKASKDLSFSDLYFSKLDGVLEVREGSLLVKHLGLENTPVGGLQLQGSIKPDATLNLELDNALPKEASMLLAANTQQVKGFLSALPVVGGALTQFDVLPTDEKGRIHMYYKVTGPVSQPKFGIDGSRVLSGQADMKNKLAASLKAKIEAEKQKLLGEAKAKKEEIEKRLQAEKDALVSKAQAEKAAAEAKVKEEANKQKENLGNKAKDEAKKRLKGFGL